MRPYRHRFAATVVAGALVIAACGGDEPVGSPIARPETDAGVGGDIFQGDAGPVADLLGLPLLEFTDRVIERGLGPVRVGWRDGEYLPVTDDLSPGRATVAIDGSTGIEVVVDASIEVDEESDEREAESAGAFDPSATFSDDMVSEPAVVVPGQTFVVAYPGGRDRGVAYVLEIAASGGWVPTHLMTATTDGYGDRPDWAEIGAEGYGWEDIGISGEGPDTLILPDTAEAGSYRLCTANSAENICTPMIVTDGPNEPPTTSVPIAPIVSTTEGVAYYPACGTETLQFEGTTWYIIGWGDSGVVDEMFAEQWDETSSREREPSPAFGPNGFARVVEPGAGDDTGTLVIWADGVARWRSDSGDLDVWLVTTEIQPLWDC